MVVFGLFKTLLLALKLRKEGNYFIPQCIHILKKKSGLQSSPPMVGGGTINCITQNVVPYWLKA